MKEEIKTTSYCLNDDGEVCAPLFHSFGTKTDEQKKILFPRTIGEYYFAEIPAELQTLITAWREKIKAAKYRESFVFLKKTQIEFGYGGKVYRIRPLTLHTDENSLELAAPDILSDLMALGCNYGEYSGYLD